MTVHDPFERRETWASMLAVLADCVRKPEQSFVEEVEDGHLQAALEELTDDLDLRPAKGTRAPGLGSLGDATESYLGLFEGMRTPFAPLAESPYKPWYGDRAGLMGGPPSKDMTRRFEAIDAEFPAGYPPDHLALELEYASLLFESGSPEEGVAFVDDHLDWVPALRVATDGAVADAPFYRWAISLVDDVTVTLWSRLGLKPVDEAAIERMAGRVDRDRTARQTH